MAFIRKDRGMSNRWHCHTAHMTELRHTGNRIMNKNSHLRLYTLLEQETFKPAFLTEVWAWYTLEGQWHFCLSTDTRAFGRRYIFLALTTEMIAPGDACACDHLCDRFAFKSLQLVDEAWLKAWCVGAGCCRMLQGIAACCCSVLQCSAVFCSVLQCVAVLRSALPCSTGLVHWSSSVCVTHIKVFLVSWFGCVCVSLSHTHTECLSMHWSESRSFYLPLSFVDVFAWVCV